MLSIAIDEPLLEVGEIGLESAVTFTSPDSSGDRISGYDLVGDLTDLPRGIDIARHLAEVPTRERVFAEIECGATGAQ